jgi:hypothetical protein
MQLDIANSIQTVLYQDYGNFTSFRRVGLRHEKHLLQEEGVNRHHWYVLNVENATEVLQDHRKRATRQGELDPTFFVLKLAIVGCAILQLPGF